MYSREAGAEVAEFEPDVRPPAIGAFDLGSRVAGLVAAAAACIGAAFLWQVAGGGLLSREPWGVTLRILTLLPLLFFVATAVRGLAARFSGRRPSAPISLEIAGGAGVVGSLLRGEIRSARPIVGRGPVVLLLVCEANEEYDESTSYASAIRLDETVVDNPRTGPSPDARVPFTFSIPSDAWPTGHYRPRTGAIRHVKWQIEVHDAGANRIATIDVPIRSTDQPTVMPPWPESWTPIEEPLAEWPRPSCARVTARDRLDGEREYRFPWPGWTPSVAAWAILTAPLWVVLPWLALQSPDADALAVMAALLLAALVNAHALVFLGGWTRWLVVSEAGIVKRAWLWRRRVHVRRVRRVYASTKGRSHYVWLECDPGPRVLAGETASLSEARWLAGDVDRALRQARDRRAALAAR